MDFSRAVLLSLGIVFHAALLCENRGAAFCGLAALLHTFRMESFFLIAGFFSAMALQKRSVADFVVQRIVRLGVPMLFCGVTVAWWVDIVRANELPLATAFDVHFWLGGHWRAHLWFLGTLLVYVAIVFAVHTLAPNVDRLVRRHRIPLVGFVAVVALSYFVAIHLCKLAPNVFGGNRWVFASAYEVLEYLPFFAAGYYLFLHPDLFDALVGRVGWNVACVVAFAIALWTIPQVSAGRYVLQTLKAAYALSMCALVFWVARRYFDQRRPLVRSFSEASYTIYLVHWPVLVLLNRALDAWQVPVGLEFLALTVATGVLSYYFHTLVVNRVPVLAFLLNGRTPVARVPVVYRVSPSHR